MTNSTAARGARTTPSAPAAEEAFMPGSSHIRGVSAKEQRQYEHIKESAERSGRYGKRAKEVAARTVLKRHRQAGHLKGR